MATPVVSSISPNQGTTSGGTVVTVTGVGFTGVFLVRFGAKPAASFTVNSNTQITAVSPPGTGTVNVVVTSDQGNSAQQVPFTYVSASAPAVTSVSPNQGPAAGGTQVTITGTGFTGTTAVKFDGVPATSFTVNSATQITAVTPAHGAGAAAVTVTAPGGTSNPSDPSAYFYYVALPSVTTIAPPSGPTAGGTSVTLTGTDLLGATAVKFDGVSATSFTVNSATQITAVTPPHAAGSATVTVTTPGGTSEAVSYVYLGLPTLLSMVPDKGPADSGITVTLTGTNLATTTAVKFGSVLAPFTIVSATQITAFAPAGAAGPVSVVATTSAGSSNALTYTRIPGPGI
ncbi:IPT/TIG domain-containing protein [Streptomyces sp. NPDC087512]|uniref:IPT/TIG domain-containing protein n=1 Tax=unclassified Streptomyces TaxID=2593676 RepID=UPI003423454F